MEASNRQQRLSTRLEISTLTPVVISDSALIIHLVARTCIAHAAEGRASMCKHNLELACNHLKLPRLKVATYESLRTAHMVHEILKAAMIRGAAHPIAATKQTIVMFMPRYQLVRGPDVPRSGA